MTTTYATAQDVANYLRMVDPATGTRINVDSLPSGFDMTKAEIETMINMAEDQVDRECDHSWRTLTVSGELHDFRDPAFYGVFARDVCVCLNRFPLRSMDHSLGDKLEVWQISTWVDLIDPANGITEGMGPDDGYWIDETTGTIHFGTQRPSAETGTVRVTYRHGEMAVPSNIRKAVILLAAIDILDNDRYRIIAPEGATLTYGASTSKMKEQVGQILATYQFHPGV